MLVSAALLLAGSSFLPHRWCARQADEWYEGDAELQTALARGVARWVNGGLSRSDFSTGSSQFNGEWLFGTYMMAGMGFGQSVLEHPDRRTEHVRLMERCLDELLSDDVRAFDREMWGTDPIETLEGRPAHGAYLGYLNLLLSLHRRLAPDSAYAALNDRITAALAERIRSSRTRLVESYPGEVYLVDNCAVIGSIGLHARATGADRRAFLDDWAAVCRERYVDPRTGLLYQAVDVGSGEPLDDPRGSGTTLGLYALSFADMTFSRELYEAVRRELAGTVFGFGGVKEYPASVRGGRGDIDSGPIVFGFGLSPSGFLLSGCRIHRDPAFHARLFATAYAWGAPVCREGRMNFVTGASLGDAILFAMLTAGGQR